MTTILACCKAPAVLQSVAVIQALLALSFFSAGQSIRTPSLQHRPIPAISPLCENTAAGRHYMTDSLGIVCKRGDLNRRTGCCTNGAKHSCETCESADHCCSSYEHCVSCCMEPSHGAEQLWKTVPRVGGKIETGQWQNAFQYCAGKCRTSSKSTSHETSYIDDRHFCFSPLGRPKTIKNAPPIPNGVQVFVGNKGQDCNAVCHAQRMACSVAGMLSINHCDALREHLPCEAGCQPDAARQDAPSYVVYGSAKPLSPTLCFVRGGADTISCGAAAAHVQRLCACAAPSDAAAAAPAA